MQEKHLYEYAVIRVVPRVEREEFINVGVIVFCKKQKFIKMIYEVNVLRLKTFSNDLDHLILSENLKAFHNIAHGIKNAGPIAQFEISERFRWLTAIRSSIIQTSRPHPGLCVDLEARTQKLFAELVS
ncbi:DUF3037 domain-containing protein [Flavobacterium sp. NST-5]|uniref:DUF3037 domain-containing protein n=1 Tax=Flavobacterium ichthyis TaxID=2698827 RepID=A0ABW9ZDA0_9FLAO|nr:DUF3037 domain-containing protein [Flavobacterium ichthyis]NBL65719.1 DUF3037 domain-containing protein [Flavobacterium ichthyis]